MHQIIDRYCGFYRKDDDGREYTTRTRLVRVELGVNSRSAQLLAPLVGDGPVAIFLDENTRRVAGDDVIAAFQREGIPLTVFELRPQPDADHVVCDDTKILEATELLGSETFTHAIAVGAGTINDVVKMASFRRGIDYSVVATAPSMNGYTSAIAAILSDGVKTTQPCDAPVAALADPRVMAEAPYRMIASGIGDLYSKPVSNADWRLSHRLLGTFHSPIVMEIVEAASELLDGVAPRLVQRDVDAVGRLTGAIMLSGLAMQAAGTSGPASGGEHLVSHYIDMTGIALGLPYDFHGCQVAVGTCATSALYEEVMRLDPAAIDVDALADAHVEWPDYEPLVRQRFGMLDDAVLAHASAMYPTREQVRERLRRIVSTWDDLMADVGTTLRPTAELRAELDSAECPTRFAQIGVSSERGYEAIAWSKDIRARYTILHLASELGILEPFARRYLDSVG